MYLHGALQVDIADALGINQSTVSRDLQALHKEWQESALIDVDAAKAQELARVDELERTYWEAWIRSCEDAETATTKAVTVGADKRYEAATRRQEQTGDPRFLAGVQWCIEQRCKIIGLYAPTKQEKDAGGELIFRVVRERAETNHTDG